MWGQRGWLAIGASASIAAGAAVAAAPAARADADRPARQASAAPGGAVAHLQVFGVPRAGPDGRASHPRLDGSLAQIAERYAAMGADHIVASLHAINPAARFRLAAPLVVPEVLIDAVTTGNTLALKRALQNLGLRDAAAFSNDVGGWLPVDQIAQAAALAELQFARASMPRTRAGPVATQGDFVQRTAAIRASYPSLTGAGITVGVLSDSFNCYLQYAQDGVPASGANGYASNSFTADYAHDQISGALPASIDVLEEAACLDYGAPEQLPFGDEGRALLQIVHAVAPDAALAFYTAANSEADFAAGIRALGNAGARIIDDDVGYPDEPFFQDGEIAQAIDTVAASGVAYFSSAGNNARNAYDNLAPSFPMTSGSGPTAGEKLLNFDTSGATTTTALPVTIPSLSPGEFVILVLQWDQPYVTGARNSGGATSALDLCVNGVPGDDQIDFAPSTTPVNCSGLNTIGHDPLDLLVIGNSAAASAKTPAMSFTVSIALASGSAAPGRIKLALDGDGAAVSIDQFATYGATIQGHPGAAGATAVGAAYYFDTPLCGTTPALLEYYSSAGGDPILFDVNGVRLATPLLRQKPQIVGPDGVNDTFLGFKQPLSTSIAGCENDNALPNFFGTSAAAPHIAAAAALMMQANPAVTAAQIAAALQNSALPMGGGLNNDSGYGFIQAQAALALLPPAPPSLSLSPAAVTIGQSATLSWSSISTTSCSASGSWSGTQATSGSLSVTPGSVGSSTYSLRCSGAGGSNASSVTLTTTAASKGGGGGSLDAIALLALCGVLLLRRHDLLLRRRPLPRPGT
jgi:hypothetical protein